MPRLIRVHSDIDNARPIVLSLSTTSGTNISSYMLADP